MDTHIIQRTLAVKLDLDLKKESDKSIYGRIRELSWQAMQYGNNFIRALWAEASALRIDPSKGDPHDLTKHVRRFEKGELSGAAYSAIEREASAAWQRYARKILAGAPWPQFREGKSLSIRGHAKNENESGVKLKKRDGYFILQLQAQAATCEGGCWIEIPLKRGTELDKFQGPLLEQMASWTVPIRKAVVIVQPERGRVITRLAYAQEIKLPKMGNRVATIGPVSREGDRLLLRSECDTIDYTSKLATVLQHKKDWELIRRRVCRQIGRRKGSARAKRKKLSLLTWDEWIQSYLHDWSWKAIDWCKKQGIGKLIIAPINGPDWPAYKFTQMLKYKGEELGIEVSEYADLEDASTERAAKSEIKRQRKSAQKVQNAVNTLINREKKQHESYRKHE